MSESADRQASHFSLSIVTATDTLAGAQKRIADAVSRRGERGDTVDSDFIERLIGLFERSRLTELEFTENGRRVRLARAGSAGPDRAAEETAPPDVATRAPVAAPADSASAGSAPAGRHVIPAGMFGVFYRSPAPGQAPFVSVGDLVREGQTIAILEAMKTLNAVEADRAGRIEAILVEDGTSVEAGTPLVAMVLSGPS